MLTKLIPLITIVVWSAQSAAGAESARARDPGQTPRPPRGAAATAMDGLWPSENLIRLMVLRWCEDISDKYELNDDQRRRYQEAEVKRWTEFMGAHRFDAQPLVNEFIELRMELEPPTRERVQSWAERATPVFEEIRGKINQATEEFREVLTPLQKAKFERDVLQLGVGMQFAEKKLQQWREGEFDPEEFWEPTRAERRKRREERRRRRAAEAGETAETNRLETGSTAEQLELDQISREVRVWEEYVEKFARVYKLDKGQRDAARSFLAELRARALSHRDRRRDEIARLEYRIARHTGSKEELAQIKDELVQLYGPIDDLFQELKRRLEQIPTDRQRQNVDPTDDKK